MLCLELSFNFTALLFKNILYQQVLAVPMGSFISSVVTNNFMACVEKAESMIFT